MNEYKLDIDPSKVCTGTLKCPGRSELLGRRSLVITIDTHANPSDSNVFIMEFTDINTGNRKYTQLCGERVEKFRDAVENALDDLMGGSYKRKEGESCERKTR